MVQRIRSLSPQSWAQLDNNLDSQLPPMCGAFRPTGWMEGCLSRHFAGSSVWFLHATLLQQEIMDYTLDPYESYQVYPDEGYFRRLEYRTYFMLQRLSHLHEKVDHMSAETDALRTAANGLMAGVDAALVAINKLVAGQANPADAAAVVAVASDLNTKSAALAAAIAAVPQ